MLGLPRPQSQQVYPRRNMTAFRKLILEIDVPEGTIVVIEHQE